MNLMKTGGQTSPLPVLQTETPFYLISRYLTFVSSREARGGSTSDEAAENLHGDDHQEG